MRPETCRGEAPNEMDHGRPRSGRRAPASHHAPKMVVAELARYPGALWVPRARYLSSPVFSRLAARIDRGLEYAVAARVEDPRGRVLLVRMQPGNAWTKSWMTPGGGAEPGETPSEAVRREIREETGGVVRNLLLWKVYHETLFDRAGRRARWDFLQYLAEWASGPPKPLSPEEIQEARWFRRLPQATAFRSDWLWPPRNWRAVSRRSPGQRLG